jgi:hypothetical protein
MKEKNWTFFRVVVYLGLTGAALILLILFYFTFGRYRGLHLLNSVSIIVTSISALQIAFNILNIRLIHHYLPNIIMPQPSFKIWHTIFIVLNSCIAILLIWIFLYSFAEAFRTSPYRSRRDGADILALALIGSYTFITISTITGSLILRRYIKYYTSMQEDAWLNQIGSSQKI